MDVIDMHNHFIAPEVIEFLAREGKHFATRIVERDGRRFFLIQEKAMRPIDGPISNAQRAYRGHGARGDHDAGGILRPVPDVSGRRCADLDLRSRKSTTTRWWLWERAIRHTSCRWHRSRCRIRPLRRRNWSAPRSWGFAASRFRRKSSSASSTSPTSRFSGKLPRRCGWRFASIRLKPRRPERWRRYFLGNLVGNLYDTGLAAALLIYGGVLERHPKLRVVLYHAGGALPALVGRLDMGYRLVPECREAIPRPPSTYANQFYFDIIAHSRAMLGHLVKTYGADRFVVGTDYPLPAGLAHPVEEVKALGLDAVDEGKILAANARHLLRL